MKPVWLGLGLGGVGALVLGMAWVERLASPWMWALGVSLGRVLAPSVGQASEVAVDWDVVERDVAAADVPRQVDAADALKGPKPKSTRASPKQGGALFVSADRVLALSTSARVPATRYVPARGERPPGLQVAGVSGLGIGVKDGDVLTKVAGAEVRSSAAVISSVLQLRARKAKAISGEFWRGQERWQIVFEMPYLEPRKVAESTPTGATPAPTVSAPSVSAPAASTRTEPTPAERRPVVATPSTSKPVPRAAQGKP